MRRTALLAAFLLIPAALAGPAHARVGAPVAGFASGPLIHQLQLTFGGQQAVPGPGARVLHRYVSDDGLVTVDLVVRGGIIDQQVLYLPADVARAHQVTFFLQDALGSVVGSQRGLLSFRAAVANRTVTGFQWGALRARFTPLPSGLIQVLVSR